MKEKKKNGSNGSWKRMFHLYRQIKIPWLWIIGATLLSMAVRKMEVLVVPYTSKIMTGAILEHGFIAAFMGMTIGFSLLESVQEAVNDIFALRFSRNVRRGVWGKILRLRMSFFHENPSQELVSRITKDATGACGTISALFLVFSIVYGIYTSFRQMYLTYKSLSLIMLTGIPIALLSTAIVGKLQYQVEKITNDAIAKNTGFFAERLPSMFHIKTSNMETEEYRKGIQANHERYLQEKKQEIRFIFIGPIGSFAQYFNQIVLLIVASGLVRAGVMKMYQVVNLYNYYMIFMSNTFMLIAMWQIIKSSHGATETIAKVMDAPTETEEGEEAAGVGEDIKFENVTFTYDGTRNILDNVSFTIPKGKVTAIVGENGCGKSTIIKLLERFYDINAGTIRVGEKKLCNLNLSQWRSNIGYLFQGNQMVRGTIAENIAYGSETYTMEEVEEAAKRANAYSFITQKENGFDTYVSNYDTKCSGGEMQRIAVARILMHQPEYLIMDEATSGLDAVNEREVIESVRKAMEGRTVIMVSHDMKMIQSADHIVVLANGTVEAAGSYEEVAKQSPQFQKFVAASEM